MTLQQVIFINKTRVYKGSGIGELKSARFSIPAPNKKISIVLTECHFALETVDKQNIKCMCALAVTTKKQCKEEEKQGQTTLSPVQKL